MKKSILYLICGIVIVAALAAMLFFVLSDAGEEPEIPEMDLRGTWAVVAEEENAQLTRRDVQFMTFTEDTVKLFALGASEPLASGSYTIDETNQMSLPELSRSYKVDKKTENYVRLYESGTKCLVLFRYDSTDTTAYDFDRAVIEGSWNVMLKGNDVNVSEKVVFEGTQFRDYRNGGADPVATSEIAWGEGNLLSLSGLGMTLYCYHVTDDVILLIENGNGTIWELARAK